MKIISENFLNSLSLGKLLFVSLLLIPMLSAMADTIDAALGEYAWKKRQIMVFTPALDDPDYQQFLKAETVFGEEFADRKLHTWHVIFGQKVRLEDVVQTQLKASDFHKQYAVDKTRFTFILLGYDMQEKLRQNKFDVDFVFATIDQMPMRMQEMEESSK